MTIGELRTMIADLDGDKMIAWTFQGEPWGGDFYIGETNVRNAEVLDSQDGDAELLPEGTIFIEMDL